MIKDVNDFFTMFRTPVAASRPIHTAHLFGSVVRRWSLRSRRLRHKSTTQEYSYDCRTNTRTDPAIGRLNIKTTAIVKPV